MYRAILNPEICAALFHNFGLVAILVLSTNTVRSNRVASGREPLSSSFFASQKYNDSLLVMESLTCQAQSEAWKTDIASNLHSSFCSENSVSEHFCFLYPISRLQQCMPLYGSKKLQGLTNSDASTSICPRNCPHLSHLECSGGDLLCFFEAIVCGSIPVVQDFDSKVLYTIFGEEIKHYTFSVAGHPIGMYSAEQASVNFDTFVDLHTIPSAISPSSWSSIYSNSTLNLFVSQHRISLSELSGNVGDLSGLAVVNYLLEGKNIKVFSSGTATRPPFLASVGSIISFVARKKGLKVIWGSGLISATCPGKLEGKTIWMGVRGPCTRYMLLKCHQINAPVIRDPGLLLPYTLPFHIERKFELGFVIHSVDWPYFQTSSIANEMDKSGILRNGGQLHTFVKRIVTYKRVVSSSLHGIIFAHAYGIPCIPIQLGDRIIGQDFKFVDHYRSLGYYNFTSRIKFWEKKQYTVQDWMQVVDSYWQPGQPVDISKMKHRFPYP